MIQIVPYFTPQVTGVGDYALALAREFRNAHDLQTRFIVANPSWSGPRTVEKFSVAQLSSRSASDLVRLLENEAAGSPILLHYSGYGFHSRGFPFWLVGALQTANVPGPLLTMFHELFAFGPPWSSAFWTSPFQRVVAAKLARLSDICFTNRRKSAQWLETAAPNHQQRIGVFPVFSNFGEPVVVPPLLKRESRGVVWGSMGRGVTNPAEAARQIRLSCQALGIQKLTVVGKTPALEIGGLPVERLENASAEQISQALLQSRAGFLDYFDGYLGKSGIFAAFASHGVIPILLGRNRSEADGVTAGREFLVVTEINGPVSADTQQRIARAASEWYESHTVSRTAAAMVAKLKTAKGQPVGALVQALKST